MRHFIGKGVFKLLGGVLQKVIYSVLVSSTFQDSGHLPSWICWMREDNTEAYLVVFIVVKNLTAAT